MLYIHKYCTIVTEATNFIPIGWVDWIGWKFTVSPAQSIKYYIFIAQDIPLFSFIVILDVPIPIELTLRVVSKLRVLDARTAIMEH